MNEAKRAFEENDFKRGAEHVEEIKKTIEEAKLERASEMLVLVEREVSDARSAGIDISRCEGIMRDAEEKIMDGDMDGAIRTARLALEEARVAETAKKRLEKAELVKKQEKMKQIINLAIAMVDEAVEYGINRKEAEDVLHALITASDEGEFDQCIFLVRELETHLDKEKGMVPGRTEANYAKVVSMIAKEMVSEAEAEEIHEMVSKAVKFYEKSGNLKRVGECYELLGKLEAMRDNPVYSMSLYQKAINTYFKSGDLKKIAKIIMAMMKELGEEEIPFYEVDDIFLIFKDGRLISHQTMRLRPDMDTQILGGMLIAIQNFVEDSLVGKEATAGLNELVYGRTRILIERGKFVTVALVISGKETKDLWTKMKKVIEEIERDYEKILSRWDGDLDKLWGARKMLEDFATKI
jgi:tetratricopeptide (TPR) repeat protein